MTPEEHRPLLVTGAHRTGTTWVGRLLAAAPRVTYISEPMNVLHRPGVFGAPVANWYSYICDENAAAYLPAFQQLLALRYHLWANSARCAVLVTWDVWGGIWACSWRPDPQ